MMLKRRGSFVSINWDPYWPKVSRKAAWRAGEPESPELSVRPGFPSLLCDLGFGPSPLWASAGFSFPAPRTISVIYNGEEALTQAF